MSSGATGADGDRRTPSAAFASVLPACLRARRRCVRVVTAYRECQSVIMAFSPRFKDITGLFVPAYLPEIASLCIYMFRISLNIFGAVNKQQSMKYEAHFWPSLRHTIHHYQLRFFMKMNCFHSFSTEALLFM